MTQTALTGFFGWMTVIHFAILITAGVFLLILVVVLGDIVAIIPMAALVATIDLQLLHAVTSPQAFDELKRRGVRVRRRARASPPRERAARCEGKGV